MNQLTTYLSADQDLDIQVGTVQAGLAGATQSGVLRLRAGRFASNESPRVGSKSRVVDFTPCVAVPGLIDACARVRGEQEESSLGQRHNAKWLICHALTLARMSATGVTTARISAGLPADLPLALREAKRDRVSSGPRIVVSSPVMPGRGATAVLAESRRRRGEGAETITALSSGSHKTFTKAQLEALADEAHRRRTRVALAPSDMSEACTALAAGFDVIEGIPCDADPSLVKALHAAGACLVHVLEIDAATPDRHLAVLESAAQAGIRIAVGSGARPDGLRRALGDLMAVSAPASAIMASVTANAAWALGLENDIGTIRTGAAAEAVLLDADPLDNPSVLADGKHVVAVVISSDPLTV